MLLHRTSPNESSPKYSDVVNTAGNLDYVQDGRLYKNNPASSVMVTAETDLDSLLDGYPAGTVAYTAGFTSMWQKDASGEWVELGG